MSSCSLEPRAILRTLRTVLLVLTSISFTTVALAEYRCGDANVEVNALSEEEHQLTCSAVKSAMQLLGRCNIFVRRPLKVQVIREVTHPLGGRIFGLFDIVQERVLVTHYANVDSLVQGTPYSALSPRAFYRSLIVHEVVHGVLYQNYKRQPMIQAALEYPAYALQIESLTPVERQNFLKSFDQSTGSAASLFNDFVLNVDPFLFGALAYQHFKSSADGCAQIRAFLGSDPDFIAAAY